MYVHNIISDNKELWISAILLNIAELLLSTITNSVLYDFSTDMSDVIGQEV